MKRVIEFLQLHESTNFQTARYIKMVASWFEVRRTDEKSWTQCILGLGGHHPYTADPFLDWCRAKLCHSVMALATSLIQPMVFLHSLNIFHHSSCLGAWTNLCNRHFTKTILYCALTGESISFQSGGYTRNKNFGLFSEVMYCNKLRITQEQSNEVRKLRSVFVFVCVYCMSEKEQEREKPKKSL